MPSVEIAKKSPRGATLKSKLARANQSILDFIAPRTCPINGETVINGYFSNSGLELLGSARIDYSHPLDTLLRRKDSDELAITMAYGLFSAATNRNLLGIVHDIKYYGRRNFGTEMGKLLGKEIIRVNQRIKEGDLSHLPTPVQYDYIIPIPIHRAKRKERSYNQSEYIAKGVAQIINSELNTQHLLRHRYGTSQTKLSATERIDNIKDNFKISPAANIESKTYLIVDDVMTTGATANEAASTLLDAGARRVDIAVLNMHGYNSQEKSDSPTR